MHAAKGATSRSPRLQPSPSLPNLRKNQHYLTPPLTPSSSLKSDSTDPDATNTPADSTLLADARQNRFLIIVDVPREISNDVVTQYLTSLEDTHSVSSESQREKPISTPHTAIQTINFRFRDKHMHNVVDKGTQKTHCEGALSFSWKEGLTCPFVNPANFLKVSMIRSSCAPCIQTPYVSFSATRLRNT
ncbi:hypothetical protein SCLCIDRAFT_826441 [Scleroderma citrinum Foug A]|uniref:Uncharacterized protein n=1 Tax=Scleroderma citrinum Foug A TaxID=1036808 RepID=A0A0C3E8Z9_9AGAM|nr:hypothetical protein SCLCIDRAFT_826441 [Scleroderma citrinum Foug A]